MTEASSPHKGETKKLENVWWLEDSEMKARSLKAMSSPLRISVLTVSRLLLNFVVFSNLFIQKRSFQTQCLLDGDILIFVRISNWIY